ncbi:integrase catalytic domain-containing protein [Trichonephila clavipes]|nr:integrase catalytic domain-containing protein [Trichonephila clavipes]
MKFLEKRSAVLENITRIPSTKMIHKNTAMSTKAKSLVVNSKKITVKPCILCRNSHPLYKCIAFQNMSVECRKKFVTNNKLCINCLRLHYGACMSKYKCTVSGCKGLHNSLLHDSAELCSAVKNHTVGERGIESNSNPTRFEGQPEVAVLTYGNKCVLLNTFMIFVKSADGYRIKLRGLLDNASTICVLREDIARKLGFKFKSANQSITGINGITQSSKYSANIEVSNRDYTFARNVQFSLLPKITDAIPVSKLNISDLNIPASIELADYNFHMPGQIDILIGSELFFEILNPEQYYLQEGNVILQNTKFGYLVTGTLPQSQQQANCCLISEPSLDITVKKFFELESLPDDSKEITKSEEEIYCEEHFVSTYKRDKTGRFIVRLPIKENAETLLGYSKENAIKRLNGIWEKLNKNNTMGTLYKEFMNEYELLGHMEEIKNETLDKINYYIPHHSVYKPEKTSTPLRVVFDASAKTTSGFSLNSILLNGGIIQQDLFSIVSRFRKHEYAFSADIKKMYRQILVDPNQRDLQRIMWKTSANAPVKTYKLATVTYGTVSAPFLATRTLRALADEEKAEFPDAADVICNDSYMDDILSGESTLEGAKKLQTRLSQLLQRGGFELHKWVSNSPELLKDLSTSSYVFDKEFQDAPVKTLGMLWDPKVDCLTYKVKISDKVNFSKRDVLSEIARLYDPLDLIGPIVTKAKIFIQELWKIKLDWSEQLPPDAMEEWMNFYQKLAKVNNFKIPRCILLPATIRIEIHGFSDASERAYAAVVYIKCFNESGQSQTRLLCSKSRVAPLKTLTTIPRVAEIQALSKDYHWKHVSSKNNPADLISRGCNVDELLKNEMWFSGPDLQTDEYEDNQLFPDPSYRDELKCAVTLSMTEFINNIKAKESCNMEKYLTADEVKRSTEFLAKIAQLSEFKAEIDALKKGKGVSKTHKTLVNSKITFEEFETIIIQIEGILNSRPLVPLSDNINEYGGISMYIIGRPISAIPEPAILDISDNRLSRWQYTTKCVQTIWKRWKNDYLNHLQQRNKWQFEKNNVAVGCLVLLKENDLPPCKWTMARILEVIYGTDGLRKMYDSIEMQIRSLQSLGVATGTYSNLLCPVILQKLLEELNLDYNRQRKTEELFDINDLVEFLRKEVECREASLMLANPKRSNTREYSFKNKTGRSYQYRSNYLNTENNDFAGIKCSTAALATHVDSYQHKHESNRKFVPRRNFHTSSADNCKDIIANHLIVENEEFDFDRVRNLRSLETIGINPDNEVPLSDKEILKSFEQNMVYTSKKYETRLLWKEDCKELKSNYEIAKRRLLGLSKTFEKNEELYLKYDEIIKEHLRDAIIERVNMNLDKNINTGYFLPHHAVVREQKDSTKVRIVFDASSKGKGAFITKRLFRERT